MSVWQSGYLELDGRHEGGAWRLDVSRDVRQQEIRLSIDDWNAAEAVLTPSQARDLADALNALADDYEIGADQ